MKRLLIAVMMIGLMGCSACSVNQFNDFFATYGPALSAVAGGMAAARQQRQADDAQGFQAFREAQVNKAAQAFQPPLNCIIRPAPTNSMGQPLIGGNATAQCQ